MRSGASAPAGTPGRGTVAAVVLAAGRATRMGGGKLLLPIGGRPMVQRVVDAALASKVAQTVVVVGSQAEEVRRILEDRPVTIVENQDYADGMSSSLRAGLAAVDPGCGGVLILLGDQPFVGPALIDALVDRFAACGKAVVRPVADGRPGNPVLVGVALVPELLAEKGDVGGRRVVGRHADDVCLVTVDDPRELADIDSPQDYEKERDL
jgi:molybdenum cofactor cytidylyltransferase